MSVYVFDIVGSSFFLLSSFPFFSFSSTLLKSLWKRTRSHGSLFQRDVTHVSLLEKGSLCVNSSYGPLLFMSANVNSLLSSLPAYPMFFLSLVLVIYKSNAYDRCLVKERERKREIWWWLDRGNRYRGQRTYNRGWTLKREEDRIGNKCDRTWGAHVYFSFERSSLCMASINKK